MDLDRELEVKLPLMGKSIELEALPGQDPAVRYGVIWDVCQQPGDGLGYIVQFRDSRTCNILAWMGRGGVVHECDRPIAFVVPGVPVVEDGTPRVAVAEMIKITECVVDGISVRSKDIVQDPLLENRFSENPSADEDDLFF